MASSYSTNLKIELMTTGEKATTWGDVTNTNLGTALEESIVGTGTVTFSSADLSISLTNSNATQTARNIRLDLAGTTGGSTRTLTVPDIEKTYIIDNGCADSVAISNSTGTTVTVPAGKTMWVYSTGSNVVDVTTHLTSLTVGASADPVVSEAATQTLTNKTLTTAALGDSTATTQTTGDNTTKVATTAFVQQEIATEHVDTAQLVDGAVETAKINDGAVTSAKMATTTNGYGTRTVSTSAPTGGSDGDVWYRYE